MHESSNRPLLVAIIVIGIIIIILLASPRGYSPNAGQYSYRGNLLTASVVPFNDGYYTTSSTNLTAAPGHYSIVRSYPHQTSYTTYGTAPTYYYQSSSQTTYPGEEVFPDGCTLTSQVSTTTGQPCS